MPITFKLYSAESTESLGKEIIKNLRSYVILNY